MAGGVYGVWTEKPTPPTNAEEKKTDESKTKKREGTVVKVGTADFPAK